MRVTGILIGLLGIALAAWLVWSFDADAVFGAVRAVGAGGFLLFCGWSVLILLVLGLAQSALLPELRSARWPAVAWARAVREAAGDVLPFTQLGGLVAGARELLKLGLPAPRIYGAMIADQTAELAAQAIFTLMGAAGLVGWLVGDGRVPWGPVVIGMAASLGVMAAFILLQRPMLKLAEGLAHRLLPGDATSAFARLHGELGTIYARRGRLAVCAALHLVGWTMSGVAAWIALRLMGVEAGLGPVIIIEALVFALRTAVFFIPGAIGVQEGAYALLGPLFGLPPEIVLALSIVKRAREFALGVPTLVLWQASEGRRALGGPSATE